MPQFKIEQLALRLPTSDGQRKIAMDFLARCGMSDWVLDSVEATGTVMGRASRNRATLQFNYSAFDGKELELLRYEKGTPNWLDSVDQGSALVSHIGMHCSEEDLAEWRRVMADFNITLAQEVWTDSHSNPRIRGCRRYHYVIYDTRELIGVDMKFIVRRIINQEEEDRQAEIAASKVKIGGTMP